jgi:hypothetical protein
MNDPAPRDVTCPKCRTVSRVAAAFEGVFRCPKCKAGLRLGGPTKSQARASDVRDKSDTRTAQRALIGFGVAAVVVAIFFLSQEKKPRPIETTSPLRPPTPTIKEAPDPTPVRRTTTTSSQPEAVVKKMIRALASEDSAQFDELFDYRKFYSNMARKNHWEEERHYDKVSVEAQAAYRDDAKGALLSADRATYLRDYLLKKLDGPAEGYMTKDLGSDYGAFNFDIKNEAGKSVLLMRLVVSVRDGFDAVNDAENPKAWAVSSIDEQWLVTTVGRPNADRRMKDPVEEARKERAIATRRSGGFPEEEPTEQAPLPGTSAAQAQVWSDAIVALGKMSSSAKELRKAREQLVEGGKPAIPYLLNALRRYDHNGPEEDRIAASQIVNVLTDITGEQIDYGPMNTDQAKFGMVSMTPEERATAVRRWFGWWKTKGAAFERKKVAAEPDDLEDPKPPK